MAWSRRGFLGGLAAGVCALHAPRVQASMRHKRLLLVVLILRSWPQMQ